MLWTIFKCLIVVWMLQIVFQFGASALPLILVVLLIAFALRLIIRRATFNSAGLHCAPYNQFRGHGAEAIPQKSAVYAETGEVQLSHG